MCLLSAGARKVKSQSSRHIHCMPFRFSRSPYSKVLALLYLTLALVFIGALGLKSVTQQSFYSAVWETIAGQHSHSNLR